MKDFYNKKIRVGLVGTGMIARGLTKLIPKRSDMEVSGVLTRRNGFIDGLGIDQFLVTKNPEILFEKSDLIMVSTGDPIYATEIIFKAFKYNLPVLTMDADTQVVTGSWLSQFGVLSEGNGDQPGCLAVLKRQVVDMGFTPLVYGNIKGYQNLNPTHEDMIYWAEKQGFSLNSVTSFTDGTKVQIEQCLVANGLGADIAKRGLLGVEKEDFKEGVFEIAREATKLDKVLSDYIISRTAPPGVFIVATHQEDLAAELKTYKLGDGPHYLLYNPIHLCFFELIKEIKDLYNDNSILLDNGKNPKISVAAVAKRAIKADTFLEKGIGSFEVRGEAIKISEKIDHIPIGLLSQAKFKYDIEPGQILTFEDVEIPESLALRAWMDILKNNVAPAASKKASSVTNKDQ